MIWGYLHGLRPHPWAHDIPNEAALGRITFEHHWRHGFPAPQLSHCTPVPSEAMMWRSREMQGLVPSWMARPSKASKISILGDRGGRGRTIGDTPYPPGNSQPDTRRVSQWEIGHPTSTWEGRAVSSWWLWLSTEPAG